MFSKHNAYSIGRIFLHNNRLADDGVQHANKEIDNERTVYNYHIKKGTTDDVKRRVSEVFVMRKSDTTLLGEMMVTLPQNVKREDERAFFQAVYDFYVQEFGEENIINAVVHKDETKPHIHLDFIPVLKGEPSYTTIRGQKAIEDWKNSHNGESPKERICCKDLITRKYLLQMHQRLSEYVKEYIGYEVDIVNGATEKGNKTVLELKAETLKKEVTKMEKQKKHLTEEVDKILGVAKKQGLEKNDLGLYPLMQKIADLENQNAILKSIITRQGYKWKKEDLEAIKEKKYTKANSISVNVYDGSLVDAEIEKNAVIVIELPDQIPRPLPQQKLINQNPALEKEAKFIQTSIKQVVCKKLRKSEQIYVFIKTDSTKQTLENLLLMEKQLREIDLTNRKIYMDRIATDDYDLARSILTKDQYETLYFTGNEVTSKTKETELTKTKEK